MFGYSIIELRCKARVCCRGTLLWVIFLTSDLPEIQKWFACYISFLILQKDIGEGLNTTFQAMRKLKLKEPIIEQRQSYVLVTLYHEPLGTYEELIVKYLEEFDEINNSKAREICLEGSENKVKRTFEKMMTAGLIERIPERRGVSTAYRLVKKSSTEG